MGWVSKCHAVHPYQNDRRDSPSALPMYNATVCRCVPVTKWDLVLTETIIMICTNNHIYTRQLVWNRLIDLAIIQYVKMIKSIKFQHFSTSYGRLSHLLVWNLKHLGERGVGYTLLSFVLIIPQHWPFYSHTKCIWLSLSFYWVITKIEQHIFNCVVHLCIFFPRMRRTCTFYLYKHFYFRERGQRLPTVNNNVG